MKTSDPIHASGPYVLSTMAAFACTPRLGLALARLSRPDPLILLDPRLRGARLRLRVRQRAKATR